MSDQIKVAVVGGGITGLSSAYYISKNLAGSNFHIDIFEKKSNLGGVIETRKTDDLLLEAGPDSFFTQKPFALDLCHELGLTSRIIETNSKYRQSLLAKQGRLYPLPSGFVMFAPSELVPFVQSDLLTVRGKLRASMELVLPPKLYGEEETVAEFVTRRFGKEILDQVAQPMIGGIYVGDVNKLSAQSTVPQFIEMERTSGSVTGGLIKKRELELNPSASSTRGARYSMFLSLKGGMQELISRLETSTANSKVHFEKQLTGIRKSGNQWILDFSSGEEFVYDAVILTLPSSFLKEPIATLDKTISQKLSEIPCASSVVVNFVFERQQTDYPFNAFGFVVPAIENRPIIAASFSSVKFADRCSKDKVIVRVFLGGVLSENILRKTDNELIDIASSELSNYLNITGAAELSWLNRYHEAMPQYLIGHKNRVSEIFSILDSYPGLALAGNSYTGVGIPDCINSAKKAAKSISSYLSQNKLTSI